MSHDINEIIINYLKPFHPKRIGVFGSYARKEDGENSDIDILVDFEKPVSLFDLGGIKVGLSEKLNRPIDIVTNRGLNHRIRPNILNDLKIIF